MAFFAYGYFVKTAAGIFQAGHDFSPTLDTYEVGDSLGIRNGVEGIVVGILKGEAAKRSGGYHVFVLLEEREPQAPGPGAFAVEEDFFETEDGRRYVHELTREPARLVSRPQIQATVGDKKFRAVGNKLYRRPLRESFYDFQLNHLLWLLGEDWFNAEMAKSIDDRSHQRALRETHE